MRTQCLIKPKLRTYMQITDPNEDQKYIKITNKLDRLLLAKLKLKVLPLKIETGRYTGWKANVRFCNVCNGKKIEDEIHFIFNCSRYQQECNIFSLPDLNLNKENKTTDILKRMYQKDTYKLGKFIRATYIPHDKIWFIVVKALTVHIILRFLSQTEFCLGFSVHLFELSRTNRCLSSLSGK